MTNGTPRWWNTSISALHTDEWYSPATPTTPSWVMSFSIAVAPWAGVLRVSSMISSTCLPSNPPAALTSSTAHSRPYTSSCPC